MGRQLWGYCVLVNGLYAVSIKTRNNNIFNHVFFFCKVHTEELDEIFTAAILKSENVPRYRYKFTITRVLFQ